VAPADAGDAAVVGQQLLHGEALADLGPGGPGHLQQQQVKDYPARAVDGVHALEGRVAAPQPAAGQQHGRRRPGHP
jgi:hypothetical protein